MRIAIEGCAHGELESIYDAIIESEKVDGKKVDLLICCGDFQATRNLRDLKCMAVPDKYKEMGTFYKYYTGEKVAPILTIFIGGNHEASNHLQELSYGGWAAPNIYYLGYAGVVTVAGIRIAGMSGIYKSHDYMKGHHEYPPYNNNTMRSAYHIRNLDIFRLKQLSGPIDIIISHDWPLGITEYGNVKALLRKKAFFKEDIENNTLGSPPAMEVLKQHYPTHWFAAHLHCKFAAVVSNEDCSKTTKFLALDKCLPRRKFIQVIDIDHDQSLPIKLSYDLEWLTILYLTNHLLSVKNTLSYMPGPHHQVRWKFVPLEEEKERIHHKLNYDLTVPLNFKETVERYDPENPYMRVDQPNLSVNHQTTEFCDKLGIDDPFALIKMTANIPEDNEKIDNSFASSTPVQHPHSADHSLSTEEDEQSMEGSDEEPQFVIDTVPTYNSRTVMSPLKMPAAKNEGTICIDDDTESKVEDQTNSPKNTNLIDAVPNLVPRAVMSSLKLPPVKNGSKSTDETESEAQAHLNSSKSPRRLEDANKASDAKVEPNTKKFKRRNQSIYTDTECTT
ncbi:lariat debranching enzyme [Nasonia vitripennis]|uniref:Lariat debranching enzyme C-terminal domain-containing protein n=1 Tax=Nasonia vitripennis TaxID=7425 RepID=A0A7M7H7U2_NASVI|nr:lariat debranching enzyme [Nasonia vitripennis]